jgi:hypothetical protein
MTPAAALATILVIAASAIFATTRFAETFGGGYNGFILVIGVLSALGGPAATVALSRFLLPHPTR